MVASVSTWMGDRISMSISSDSPSDETLNQSMLTSPQLSTSFIQWINPIHQGVSGKSSFCKITFQNNNTQG